MTDFSKRISELSPEKRALLIKRLQNKQKDSNKEQRISKRENQSEFPMSFAQERMWFLHQFNPNSPLYNIAAAIQIKGPLNTKALEQSLNDIIHRHEVFRATFKVEVNRPVQYIVPELILNVPIIDLQELPVTERKLITQKLAQEIGKQPFDLVHGPLLRAKILRMDEEEYILLFVVHHIVYDGWSTEIFIRELGIHYDAYSNGRSLELPELNIQYADFAEWQRQWLQDSVFESQLAYWKKQLEGIPQILELPTDRQRPVTLSYYGAQYRFELPQSLSEAILKLSRKEDMTLFMTLLAAFQTLLYRYTGQKDICIGTPIANRNRSEIESLIGFFVNTLVIRTEFSDELTFRQLLNLVRNVTLDAYSHQDLPFEKIVEELQIERNLNHNSLFQVMFDFQNVSNKRLQFSGLTLDIQEIETETAKFDLMLMMEADVDELKGLIEYNTDLFEASTIKRMIDHFETLLESIVANPDQPISTLPILTSRERKEILIDWNKTDADFPYDLNIHQLFEEQVKQTPNGIAVIDGKEHLTYNLLNERSNQLALYLRKQGVTAETLVALYVERSLNMIVGIMGILKAGGAYVPLDPKYPKERLTFILEDISASVVLTEQNLLEKLPDHKALVICLDADWKNIKQESNENPVRNSTVDNLAYVIYTSGSTGRPKGVAVMHRGVTALIDWGRKVYNKEQLSKVLFSTSICFDVSVFELFVPLSCGGTIILAKNVLELPNLPAADTVTLISTVPSAITELLRIDGIPPSVHTVHLAGEFLATPIVKQLYQQETIEHVFDLYGPSEDTVYSTFALRDGDALATIGRPISNKRVYILDKNLQPVPVNIPGELYIEGVGQARGYFNRPDLTAELFIPNPVSSDKGGRLYKTGDLTRYRPDGTIEYLGRIDHQVKIRGFRIELGEIESVLREHPAIIKTVILAREDKPGEKYLVAYIVFDQGSMITITELRNYLLERLPEYMVPSFFVILDKLPLTPNGKINRRALLAPDRTRPELEKAYKAPQTELEKFLANIWKECLGVDKVGIYDNFFELGGDSLKAAVLVNRLQQKLGEIINVGDLFIAPTIDEFSKYLRQNYKISLHEIFKSVEITPTEIKPQEMYSSPIKLTKIDPISRDGDLVLSFAQQRLWFIDHLGTDTPLYNLPAAVRLDGDLNIIALEKTINEIIHRHEILRTTFSTVDGKAIQVIAPKLSIPLIKIDLLNLTLNEREIEAQRLTNEDARQPFDLSEGPLIRMKLIQLGVEEFIFIVTMHHIISDGWSTAVFIREMATLYNAFSSDQPSPLKRMPIQYADFAYWQRQWLQNEFIENQISYWKKQLEGLPPLLELPADRPRQAIQTFRGAIRWFELSVDQSEKLKELSKFNGVTLFMTLLAAFQTLLYRYTGQEDISIGTPIANRNRAEIEELIGFFVNTLVIRTDFSGQPSFKELLRQVKEVTLAAYAHQDVPFEMLVETIQPTRDLSHSPLFQVMFVLQNVPMDLPEMTALKINPLKVDNGTAKFDITLVMYEDDSRLMGMLEYNVDLFDASTIARFTEHFQIILNSFIDNPDQSVLDCQILTNAEKQLLLKKWNNTDAPYPHDKCIHQLFEIQAERTPDEVAVVFKTEHLTYQELNFKANKLGQYLRKLGVGPEVLVGICVERSLDMIIAIMGILKAGGAYVPLDPIYPKERLDYMVNDAQLSVLLTHKQLVANLPANNTTVVSLDTDWSVIDEESEDNFITDVLPQNLAYIIYTSGSTGRPKGVQLNHEGVCNFTNSYIRLFDIQIHDRVLQFFSYSFDGSVGDIFMTLSAGATLCLVDKDNLLPGPGLVKLMQEQEITITIMPPSVLMALSSEELPKLQKLGSGGDSSTRDLVTRWTFGRHYFNLYGPTEATVVSATYLTNNLSEHATSVPIGHPMDNFKLYILDSHLNPVPIGVTGELHISGVGLARGYLNRSGMTAEKFIPDPFSINPGGRMYKTGDLARYLPDGNIEYLGRMDHQVKVRGFRIELGEIETMLDQHPELRESAVIVREDEPGIKRLVAYIVSNNGHELSISDLRSYLSESLPNYMIPSVFVTMEALPLTPNGKIDRKALPIPDQSRDGMDNEYVAPRTEKEEKLANIWRQMLNLEQVGVNDNFFELGGDSILTIQVIAKANQEGLRLSTKQFFQFPTIAGLAAVAGTTPVIQAEQGIISGNVPFTPIQKWFFEQNLPQAQHWNQTIMLEVKEPLDYIILEKVVQQLVIHHDVLRLRFTQDDQGWQQANADREENTIFSRIDLSESSETEQKTAIERIANETQASLNLSNGPLIRVVYMDLGIEKFARLLIVIHHLVIDGISWRILVEDLQIAYQQLVDGKNVQLPAKTTSFQYWAKSLNRYANSTEAQKELDYWLEIHQKGIAVLPKDFAKNENNNIEAFSSNVVMFLNEEDTNALLLEVPATYGTEINDTLMTAIIQTFSQWTGEKSLLINLEGHGRENIFDEVDISRTVGWFTSLFPVLLDIEGTTTIGEALKTIKEQLHNIPNRGIGYGLLRYLSTNNEIIASLQSLPRVEVSFNYFGQLDRTLSDSSSFGLAKESTGHSIGLKNLRNHLIEINCRVTEGKLQSVWTYSTKLHQRSTIDQLAQSFNRKLKEIIDHCRTTKVGSYTPSDFEDVELSQDEIDEIMLEVDETIA